MTATLSTTSPEAPERVVVVVPAVPADARSGWRRLVRAVDHSKQGAFALDGPPLDPGTVYELPAGALLVACDRHDDRWEVRVLTAALGGVEVVKEWTLRTPLGKRVVDYVARRLPAGSAHHRYERLETTPNRWAAWCRHCRGPVPPKAGRVVRVNGHPAVEHHPGQCPPPPETITPNRYPGLCFACGGWVAAYTGAAVRRTSPRDGGGMYEPIHGQQCPPDPVPGPPNEVAGWCVDCGELVPPDRGHWRSHRLHHTGTCPQERLGVPTWICRIPPRRTVEVGQVLRVRLELAADDPPLPESAPGWRVLDEGYVEVVAVVVEVVAGRTGRLRARIRVATPTEAADVLAAHLTLAPDARPHPHGHKARWCAEKIGHVQPWVAEITGRDPAYGYRRRFLRPDRDYAGANSKGTRGVLCWFTLAVNRVYEAEHWLTWSRKQRLFLRATPEGDVLEITGEEVEAWLDHAPVWTAS